MYELNKLLMSSFSQWLKENRKKSGLTLEQLRTAIGDLCTVAYLSKLENDKYKGKKGLSTRPDREIVVALAEAFHENLNEVLTLADYASTNENIHKIPSIFHKYDWETFNKTELEMLETFIGYLIFKRHKTTVVRIENGSLFPNHQGEIKKAS
jgi:transcriptional regulator with XRE-family HTH domain